MRFEYLEITDGFFHTLEKSLYECVDKAVEIYAEENSLKEKEVKILESFVCDCNLEDALIETFWDDLRIAFRDEAYEDYKDWEV